MSSLSTSQLTQSSHQINQTAEINPKMATKVRSSDDNDNDDDDDDDEPLSDQDDSSQVVKTSATSSTGQKPKQYRYTKTKYKSNSSSKSTSSSYTKTTGTTTTGVATTVSSSSSAKSTHHYHNHHNHNHNHHNLTSSSLNDDISSAMSRTRRSSMSLSSSSSSRANSPPQNKYRGKKTKPRVANRTRKEASVIDELTSRASVQESTITNVEDVHENFPMNNMTNATPPVVAPMYPPSTAAIYYSPSNSHQHPPQQYYYYHPNGNITTYLATPNPAYFAQLAGSGPNSAGVYQVPISAVPIQMSMGSYQTAALSGGPPAASIAGYYAPTTAIVQQPLMSPSNDQSAMTLSNESNNQTNASENYSYAEGQQQQSSNRHNYK